MNEFLSSPSRYSLIKAIIYEWVLFSLFWCSPSNGNASVDCFCETNTEMMMDAERNDSPLFLNLPSFVGEAMLPGYSPLAVFPLPCTRPVVWVCTHILP